MLEDKKGSEWTEVILPSNSLFQLNLSDLWKYRDLLFLFVNRDFVSQYKQTILGPVWYLIQPLLTAFTYFLIFNQVAGIKTETVPPILFYLSTIALWNYFSSCLNITSGTFIANQHIFGKVYFPRLIAPLSVTISNLIKLGFQLTLFFLFLGYYYFNGFKPHIQWSEFYLILPILVNLALISLSLGILVSSLTTKYRDLQFLIGFGTQLLMYCTPIIYPLSAVPERFRFWVNLNPLTPLVETFKYLFFGSGVLNYYSLFHSILFGIICFLISLVVFNRVERSFMDTI
jgi:lipopolysaccharide transport system permease protein